MEIEYDDGYTFVTSSSASSSSGGSRKRRKAKVASNSLRNEIFTVRDLEGEIAGMLEALGLESRVRRNEFRNEIDEEVDSITEEAKGMTDEEERQALALSLSNAVFHHAFLDYYVPSMKTLLRLKSSNGGGEHQEPYKGGVVFIRRNEITFRNSRGQIHREGDLPAYMTPTTTRYYQNNLIHRENGKPARIDEDVQSCYTLGKLNSLNDEPSTVFADGTKAWHKNGVLHRDGDKPAFISSDFGEIWFKNGLIHREGDKPAHITSDGNKFWYLNGVFHREGGNPAMQLRDGTVGRYVFGKMHSVDDKPALAVPGDFEVWAKNGEFHREAGFALQSATSQACIRMQNGAVHSFQNNQVLPAVLSDNGAFKMYAKDNLPHTISEHYAIYGRLNNEPIKLRLSNGEFRKDGEKVRFVGTDSTEIYMSNPGSTYPYSIHSAKSVAYISSISNRVYVKSGTNADLERIVKRFVKSVDRYISIINTQLTSVLSRPETYSQYMIPVDYQSDLNSLCKKLTKISGLRTVILNEKRKAPIIGKNVEA